VIWITEDKEAQEAFARECPILSETNGVGKRYRGSSSSGNGSERKKKKRRRLDEESEGEKREKEEEEKEEADAVTSSDPVVSTKKESKILITFPWMCDVCFEGEGRKVVAQSEHQRNDHLNSKKHKKNCEKRRGRELLRTMFFAEKKETTLGT